MILRRLADAIREQNWFTVVLEVAIVVVGIFLGLQVDDWNQARKDRIAEHDYLIRLQQEASATIDDMRTTDARIEEIKQAGVLILSTLETGTLLPQDRERFDYGMTNLGHINPIQWRQMTLEELKSTGYLAILSDQEPLSVIC